MRSSFALVDASIVSGVCGAAGVMEVTVEAVEVEATGVIGACVLDSEVGSETA